MNVTPNDTIDGSNKIVSLWAKNPDLKLKNMTLEQFQAMLARLNVLLRKMNELDEQLTPLRNERDDLNAALNDITIRARSAIKGYFGADSSEYELAGGTRSSERKKTGPKAKAKAAAAAAAK